MIRKLPGRSALAIAVLLAAPAVHAYRFDTGSDDLKVRWDNTLKYSTIYRLHDPDEEQLAGYLGTPAGDGDYNFDKGIASNRLDLLSEFDVVHNYNKGIRISFTGWYDSVYNKSNDNDSGFSHNQSVAADEFNSETEEAVGKDLELLDAFGFYKSELGDMPASVRLGQHTVIYGETLMSGANGIAAAQGPVDIVKAATVPGAQVKEFLLPTNQISMTLQPNLNISLGGYYQFEWEESKFFPAGSFLSPNDVVGPGNETFLQNPSLGWPVITHGEDLTPDDDGQWGLQMRYRPDAFDVELGIYAANYHDKLPSAIYTNVTPTGLTYSRVYQENIRTYGISASTVLFDDNVSIEASVRDNMPLTGGLCPPGHATGCGYFVNNLAAVGGAVVDNDENPGYAVGKTGHVTLVDIHIFQPNFLLKDGGSLATQFDWHTVRSVTKNEALIDQTTTKSASSVTFAFSADYYQVIDGLDLSFPIVWTRNLSGRSRTYIGWVEDGGSLDVGVNFTYRNVWKGGLNYHRFQGHEGGSIGAGSFDQTLFDRDYVTFNISRTF
jgi:hypothetical protein